MQKWILVLAHTPGSHLSRDQGEGHQHIRSCDICAAEETSAIWSCLELALKKVEMCFVVGLYIAVDDTVCDAARYRLDEEWDG